MGIRGTNIDVELALFQVRRRHHVVAAQLDHAVSKSFKCSVNISFFIPISNTLPTSTAL